MKNIPTPALRHLAQAAGAAIALTASIALAAPASTVRATSAEREALAFPVARNLALQLAAGDPDRQIFELKARELLRSAPDAVLSELSRVRSAAEAAAHLEFLRRLQLDGFQLRSGDGVQSLHKGLGSNDIDLVFNPLTPCRILDTRSASGGLAGPLDGGGAGTVFPAAVRLGSYAPQGGAASDCGIPTGATIKGIAATVIVLQTPPNLPNFSSFLSISDQSAYATITQAATMNFFAGQGNANTTVFPVTAPGVFYLALPPQVRTHVIIDVVGYYAAPIATALDCQFTILALGSAINPQQFGSAQATACTAGFTETALYCPGNGSLLASVGADPGTGTCSYFNLGSPGGSSFIPSAQRRCCRVPGR